MYCPRINNVTVSTEKVEKVVSPPRNPVIMNNRHSGVKPGCCIKKATEKPTKKPPIRLAESVPTGNSGHRAFSQSPSPQRSHAPKAAPTPIATHA